MNHWNNFENIILR